LYFYLLMGRIVTKWFQHHRLYLMAEISME
jgi:hypothetical protein